MRVSLAYGRSELDVEFPDDVSIVLPRQTPGLDDEVAALTAALRDPMGASPLAHTVSPDQSVVIVHSDITRPMPNDRVLPVLLSELQHVPPGQITLLNGTGTHRGNTRDELIEMLGKDIVDRYATVQHDPWDDENLVNFGQTSHGNPIAINRLYVEADVKILTGFIEPHIFAGFSGGPKAVLPGVAGFASILDNHGYAMLNDPRATWGIIEGNPVWEEMREVALMTEPDFLLNVTLNAHRQITGVYAGDMLEAHAKGVLAARQAAMAPVDAPFDVVVTTNSGYPLDINLYQAVKGMSCAAQIVKPGGSIVIAAECRNGIPDNGEYGAIVREANSVGEMMEALAEPGYRRHDQWEAFLQGRIQQKAEVHVYADGLTDEQITDMLFKPCRDIEETVDKLRRRYGSDCRICVMPEGPQTIPYLA